MEWHFRLGYAVLTLLLFRVVWGVIGGHWSRFSAFLYTPTQILNYLRGTSSPKHQVGHNPIGAISVYALLSMLMLQVISGLFSDDEIFARGPFAHLLSGDWVATATWYHKEIGQFILLGLVTLHVSAIFFYWLRKRVNLVTPMVTGDKEVDFAAQSSSDRTIDRIKALVVLGISAGIVICLLDFLG